MYCHYVIKCAKCVEAETIEQHLLYNCIHVKPLLGFTASMLSKAVGTCIRLSRQDVVGNTILAKFDVKYQNIILIILSEMRLVIWHFRNKCKSDHMMIPPDDMMSEQMLTVAVQS